MVCFASEDGQANSSGRAGIKFPSSLSRPKKLIAQIPVLFHFGIRNSEQFEFFNECFPEASRLASLFADLGKAHATRPLHEQVARNASKPATNV